MIHYKLRQSKEKLNISEISQFLQDVFKPFHPHRRIVPTLFLIFFCYLISLNVLKLIVKRM